MDKIIVFLAILSFSASSQVVIYPNKPYAPKDTVIALTIKQFDKLDSMLADTARYQKQIGLLTIKSKIMDSLDATYKSQILNNNSQIQLFQTEKLLYKGQDSLLTQKVAVYQGLVTDLQKQVKAEADKTGFFTDTFWFGTGAVAGVLAVYIGSKVR
jgi:cell division septal protein FtsQ